MLDYPSMPLPPVGRDDDRDTVVCWLQDPNYRLVTLTGPGGIGKTILAHYVAHTLHDSFSDGVHFIPLAALSAPDMLLHTLADKLQIRFRPGDDRRRVFLDALEHKQALLVLDNFEHLVREAALLQDMLVYTRHIKLILTSRERLSLHSEHLYEVKGLSVPDLHPDTAVDSYDAVRLFIDTARRLESHFVPTADDLSAIVRVCRLVEGMPLAIVMAASWIRVHSCQQIADRLDDLLQLPLTLRDVPARHSTMTTVVDHSWNLLTEAEQMIFKKLSIFRGTFDLAAAEAVAGASRDVILALRDKSLITMDVNWRFVLHHVWQQYADEKLHADPDTLWQTLDRFTGYYVNFLDARRAAIEGRQTGHALADIRNEIENIHRAWHHAVEYGGYQRIVKAVYPLNFYFFLTGLSEQGEAMFGQAVEMLCKHPESQQRNHALAYALTARARQLRDLMRIPEAQAQLDESLRLFHSLNPPDSYGYAYARLMMAFVYMMQEQTGRAIVMIRDTLRLFNEMDDPGIGPALGLAYLGQLLFEQGDFEDAKPFLLNAIHEGDASDLISPRLYLLPLLGITCIERNEYEESRAHFRSGLLLYREIPAAAPFFSLVRGIATLCRRCDLQLAAAELYALIAQHPLSDLRTRKLAQSQLGQIAKNASAKVVTSGRQAAEKWIVDHQFGGLPLGVPDAFIDYLLALIEQTTGCDENIRLTTREIDVLILASKQQDYTIEEMADIMVVTKGTVKRHIHNIGEKLDLPPGERKRRNVVRLARERGLI